MIEVFQDTRRIPEIVALAQELLPSRWQGLEILLYKCLGSPQKLVLLSTSKALNAYAIASLTAWNNELAVLIQSYAARKSTPIKDKREGWNLIQEWARASGAVKMLGFIQHDPRVFSRYGFKPGGNVILKDISLGS